MASTAIVNKIKTDLRFTHTVLDEDLSDTIDACAKDLHRLGIFPNLSDELILSAVKLWCRSHYTDDLNKAAAYREGYRDLVSSLQSSEGYGWEADGDVQ